ncbi:hypothetical protein AC1031_012674 [Aphanomyces cochlioides]|nr:hypothetical protein AC1031_012674 [Aphanomyces cochlioides]
MAASVSWVPGTSPTREQDTFGYSTDDFEDDFVQSRESEHDNPRQKDVVILESDADAGERDTAGNEESFQSSRSNPEPKLSSAHDDVENEYSLDNFDSSAAPLKDESADSGDLYEDEAFESAQVHSVDLTTAQTTNVDMIKGIADSPTLDGKNDQPVDPTSPLMDDGIFTDRAVSPPRLHEEQQASLHETESSASQGEQPLEEMKPPVSPETPSGDDVSTKENLRGFMGSLSSDNLDRAVAPSSPPLKQMHINNAFPSVDPAIKRGNDLTDDATADETMLYKLVMSLLLQPEEQKRRQVHTATQATQTEPPPPPQIPPPSHAVDSSIAAAFNDHYVEFVKHLTQRRQQATLVSSSAEARDVQRKLDRLRLVFHETVCHVFANPKMIATVRDIVFMKMQAME